MRRVQAEEAALKPSSAGSGAASCASQASISSAGVGFMG
jgi:hypothetical protein